MIKIIKHTTVFLCIASIAASLFYKPDIYFYDMRVTKGDHLLKLWQRWHLDVKTIYPIMALGSATKPLLHLTPGQHLHVLTHHGQIKYLRFTNSQSELILIRDGVHYVVMRTQHPLPSKVTVAHVLVHRGLIADGAQAPTSVLIKAGILIKNRFWPLWLQPNDQVDIIYRTTGAKASLEALHYRHRQQEAWWVSFHGSQDFYTLDGQSTQRAFDRTPLHYRRISSRFHWHRVHPVLKKDRPHKGVDLAARMGTPVWATGDGIVAFVGMNGGYGRMVKLKHGPHIMTIYAHFSRFAKGLKKGMHVKRKQIIGYVGQSGLATGPHCHYEYRMNRMPYDPMHVKLPNQSSLHGKELALFMHKKVPWVKRQLQPIDKNK